MDFTDAGTLAVFEGEDFARDLLEVGQNPGELVIPVNRAGVRQARGTAGQG